VGGPPVILVGGALNDRKTPPLVELATHLSSSFTVYNYDRRGRGDSGDVAPYAVVREVEDREVLVDEAGGSANVYGLSSGAVLALEAAAAGVDIARLALFEPPLASEDDPDTSEEKARLTELIAAGRRGEAVEEILRGIGLPDEALTATREWPGWAGMEAMAHTILYDGAMTEDRTLMTDRLPSVTAPTLILGSESSGPFLQGAARASPIPSRKARCSSSREGSTTSRRRTSGQPWRSSSAAIWLSDRWPRSALSASSSRSLSSTPIECPDEAGNPGLGTLGAWPAPMPQT
jgi:Alpha/beta hydrolase family